MNTGRAPNSAHPPLTAWLLVAIMAAVGATQLVPAIRFALKDHSSDVLRQWRVSQYVQDRVNPYPVAITALEAAAKAGTFENPLRLGIHRVVPGAPGRKQPPHAGIMPKQGPHPDTRKDVGPPEATYPPPAAVLLAFSIGYLRPDSLLGIWVLLNLVLLVLIAYELAQLQRVEQAKVWSTVCFIAIALLWPPTPYFFSRGQFSFIVLWSVLVAARLEKNRSWLAGILYSLALIKPSLALPFLIIPLIQRRWRVLAWTAGIQAGLLLFASWLLRASPLALTTEWLSVGRYFMQGMYTVQEFIDDLNLDGTIWSVVLPLVIVTASTILIYRAEHLRALAMLSLIAVIWTYHYPYDFVVLLCVIAFLSTPLIQPLRWDLWQWSGLLALAVLGIALTDVAMRGDTVAWRIVRWGGRLAVFWTIISITRAKRSRVTPVAELSAPSLSPIT
jgi:hypothetical protein